MGTAWQQLSERLPEERSAAFELLGILSSLAPEPLETQVLLEHAAALPPSLREAIGDRLR